MHISGWKDLRQLTFNFRERGLISEFPFALNLHQTFPEISYKWINRFDELNQITQQSVTARKLNVLQ